MTDEESYRRRIERLRGALSESSIEALWVEPSIGLTYLTGLDPVSLERLFALIVMPDAARLVVPSLLADESKRLPIDAEFFVWDDAEGPEGAAGGALDGIARLGIQGTLPAWSWQLLRSVRPGLEVEIDSGLIGGLRERKDDQEIDAIRRSGALTDEVVEWVGTLDLTSLTEAQLAGKIQAHYLELGVRPSEHGLIAVGANAAMPHYVGGNRQISTDEPLLMDFGCALEGYWSDITRIYFPDPLEGELSHCYDLVRAAYEAAFAAVAPGIPCKEIDAAARNVIADGGYGENFVHRTGHGLGMEVHEPPYLTGTNEQALEVGHVFSIEPGIYLPGHFGVRYENIVALTDAGPESMNHSPAIHHFARP